MLGIDARSVEWQRRLDYHELVYARDERRAKCADRARRVTEKEARWTDRVDDSGNVLLVVIGIGRRIVAESLSPSADRDATHSPDQPGNERVEGMFVAEATRHEHQRWSLAGSEPANRRAIRGLDLTVHRRIVVTLETGL